jgi:hypothetical protein
MKQPTFPLGRIENHILRRSALLIAFPLLILWHFNWRIVAFPLAVLFNAAEAALFAAMGSVRHDCTTRPFRLLTSAWRRLWSAPALEIPTKANEA